MVIVGTKKCFLLITLMGMGGIQTECITKDILLHLHPMLRHNFFFRLSLNPLKPAYVHMHIGSHYFVIK